MTSKYFRTSIYLLPSLNEALVGAIARSGGAAVDAAAGRISSTVARRSSQYTATAAAPAISVARTNIAKFTRIHMSAPPVIALHMRVWHGRRHWKAVENKGVKGRVTFVLRSARNTAVGARTRCLGESVWCGRESEVVY